MRLCKPEECHHELLQHVSHLPNPPPDPLGALKPAFVCYQCGAILFLLRNAKAGLETWPEADPGLKAKEAG